MPDCSHTASEGFCKGSLFIAECCGKGQGRILYVFSGNANVFREAARVDIGSLERGTHRIIAMPTIMACPTGNVMSHDYPLSLWQFGYRSSPLNNHAAKLMSQN